MARRILPYNQMSPFDVLNEYALDDLYINNSSTGTGFGDAGVLVTIGSGNLNLDAITYTDDTFLGKKDYPHVGYNLYPKVSQKIRPAASGDIPIGITLRQTADYDENGQKFMFNRQDKAESMQITMRGDAVPVATRGIFTFFQTAIDGSLTVGGGVKASATSGKLTGCSVTDAQRFGVVLGTGSRGSNGATNPDLYSGNFFRIKIG
jgi:hypothetical protein